jgi:ribosomal peptide maturation radical SAM protein 1
MPFAQPTHHPSIQLGLLRAIAEQAGFPADTFHFYLDLAARITPEVHDLLTNHEGHMTSEWLFAVAAFGPQSPADDQAYFTAFPEEVDRLKALGKDADFMSALRHEVLPAFVDDCLRSVDWGQYRVVGFTSTFHQNVASLALARRLNERFPGLNIVFGGSNFDGDMGPEFFRAFPFIDYAVVGEGDVVFPELLRRLAVGDSAEGLPGLLWRDAGGVQFSGRAPPVRDMDALPTPKYHEYYERLQRVGLSRQRRVGLHFESARGCWWGQKHHCTFCVLNDLSITYRSKSPDRLLSELADLSREYGPSYFLAVDEILDLRYLDSVFGKLHEKKVDLEFGYEVKANLTREQIRKMYLGGIRSIQPGIESMSTHVLKLMRKGCTMLQNVRLLKWCAYYGIKVCWNILWGFPGETEADYQRQLDVLKYISHLEPPIGCGRIWLERFAPYFTDRGHFPIRSIQPEASYRYVYPSHVDLNKVAYYFDYTMGDTVSSDAQRATEDWVTQWKQQWPSRSRPSLVYRRLPEAILIEDWRTPESGERMTVEEPWARAYEFCSETMRTVRQVTEHLQALAPGPMVDAAEVADVLEDFCRNGMMLSEDGQYLSLALPVNPGWVAA